MLAQGDEGGRATARNARFACHFRAVNYKLPTSLDLAYFRRDSAAEYSCSARIQWARSYLH